MADLRDHSSGSLSSGERGPASPPYDAARQQPAFPPHYQSKTTLHGNDDSLNSQDRGKQRTAPFSEDKTYDEGTGGQPRATLTPKGPRIAVTDPLSDLRQDLNMDGNVKSEGLYSGQHSRRGSDASSIDENEAEYFDEFDWSEDEQEQQAAKEEDKNMRAIALRRRRISPFKIIKWLATTFLGNFIISAVLAVPVIVIHFVYRPQEPQAGPGADRKDYIADNIEAWFIWAAFNLHVEWWIHLIVEVLPRIVMGVGRLAWGDVSQGTQSLVEVYNAIKRYIKLVAYAALSWASWAIIFNTIYHLYNRSDPENGSRAPYLYRLYEVIEFFFFFALTIAAEKILIKLISMRFHRTAYADRIAKLTTALQVFDHLKDHRPKLADKPSSSPFAFRSTPLQGRTPRRENAPAAGNEADNEDDGHTLPKPGFFSRKHHASHRPSDTHAQMEMPGSQPRTPGSKIKDAVKPKAAVKAAKVKASQASYLARKAMVDPTHLLTDETVGVGLDVNSPAEARRLARTLFRAYRGRHRRNYLIPSDFEVAYSDPDDAHAAFEVFDTDRNGDISVTEMKQTIVETYKDRRFVAKSLEDTSSALGQLDLIFLFVAMIVVAFEAFAIFNVDVSKTLTTFYTLAIGASFIFKESAQEVFDSIIFLFVTHPFDTGDRIVVNEAVMVVQKMSLLSCQFLLWDNTQIFINNALLSQMFITNYRRSGYQWECVTMQVAFNTPLDALDAVQADLIHWLQTEPERMFEPSTAIVPQTIDYLRSITVTIGMTHRGTYQDWGARWYRRNCFFAATCYYMRKHGVKYINSLQPIVYHQPPSYETAQAEREEAGDSPQDQGEGAARTGQSTQGASHERRESVATLGEGGDDDDVVLNDRFFPTVGQDTTLAPAAAGTKPRSFMGFTPPHDEADSSAIRRRKTRAGRKDLTIQGGDG